MNRLLCAGLLVSLQLMSPARAFEADIHYSTTFVLARAVGWSEADALTIASANEGVDENPETVAALELDAAPGPSFAGYVTSSLRQAEKNLRFHCFSSAREPSGRISADVLDAMSGHFASVPAHDENPRRNTTRLIALGVALHCQQDAHSHADFGGSCGSYAGTCYGHTHQTLLDQVVFRVMGKHYFNPDHPGVSGRRLLETLQGTVSELAAHRPKSASSSKPTHALIALAGALRESGLELPDEVRLECNRYIAGRWLFGFLRSEGRLRSSADRIETLGPEVAGTCRNASLGSAIVVRIPEPRFPRLNLDASPSLVRADGSYRQIRAGSLHVPLPRTDAAGIAALLPHQGSRVARVQLSHWSQLLALPPMRHVALTFADRRSQSR